MRLAEAVEQGLAPAPRLVVCGKALSKTGGHTDGRPRYDTHDPTRWERNFGALGRVADGVDEVRRACRQELRQGAQFIKVMANGGVSSPTDPIAWQGYSVAEMTAAVEEAQDAQTYVSAHLYTPEAIERALRCGVHSLEHCNRIDAPTARLAAEAGAVAVPTLVTYEALAQDGASFGLPPESIAKIEDVRAAGLGSLSILRDAGVTIAFGTDLLGETHVRQSEEFAIRVPRPAGGGGHRQRHDGGRAPDRHGGQAWRHSARRHRRPVGGAGGAAGGRGDPGGPSAQHPDGDEGGRCSPPGGGLGGVRTA